MCQVKNSQKAVQLARLKIKEQQKRRVITTRERERLRGVEKSLNSLNLRERERERESKMKIEEAVVKIKCARFKQPLLKRWVIFFTQKKKIRTHSPPRATIHTH